MTVTLELPPSILERAQELAGERDTDINSLLSEVIAEYFEEQEDLADAQEQMRLVREGKTKTHRWEDIRADLLARAED
jgi:predicted DNA-binding protein